MKCFVDPVGGVAGDMLLGALVDAGAPLPEIVGSLEALRVPGWTVRAERTWRGPFVATHLVVDRETRVEPTASPRAHEHDHDHDHALGASHAHAHHHGPTAGGRPWSQVRQLLAGAPLPERVRERALATFAVLAAAEGRVHGVAPDEVHFHEVGAVDAIVDIVGACLAFELLGVDEVVVGPLPLGHGSVVGEHGWIPLPAPATVELLRGFPVLGLGWPGETVTPTGAALVAALMRPGPIPAMRVRAIGVGAGTRDPASHPNVVRVLLGDGDAGGLAEVLELRAEVDGLVGEAIPPLLDALLGAGAIDAYVTPITMKKGRPGFLVTALCDPARRAAVGDALLRHGRTLGFRWSAQAREVLARRHVEVATPHGPVRVKVGERGGQLFHAVPEYEDCARAAGAAGLPVAQVMADALAAWAAMSPGKSP